MGLAVCPSMALALRMRVSLGSTLDQGCCRWYLPLLLPFYFSCLEDTQVSIPSTSVLSSLRLIFSLLIAGQ